MKTIVSKIKYCLWYHDQNLIDTRIQIIDLQPLLCQIALHTVYIVVINSSNHWLLRQTDQVSIDLIHG